MCTVRCAIISLSSPYIRMINELFPEEKRRLEVIEYQLNEFERGSPSIQSSDISLGLQEMASRLDELDRVAQREHDRMRKEDFRRRVQHLRTAHAHIRSSFESLLRRREQDHHHLQRQSLFAGARGQEISDRFDVEMAESDSLARSSRMVGDYIQTGQETLMELMSQRERLKGVQRHVFDMLNYLGVSNAMLKSVERREVWDRIIVYAGMVLITLLIIAVWWFRRK